MAKAEVARRGGAVRVRTVKLSGNRVAHVYVVPKRKAKRGGPKQKGA